MEPQLGYHIGKDKSYTKTFKNVLDDIGPKNISNFPIQIFTGSTKMWRRAAHNENDFKSAKNIVETNKISAFIHSIYLINMSRIGPEFEKAKECLKYDLDIGPKIGAKGVVVHVGKSLKMDKTVAVDNMFKNILGILEFINESCPLLIETPAGQGTEILTDIEDFIEFYNLFDKEQKRKVRICIDTCHVFASGYDPLDYLKKWNTALPDSIVLVHFNDSKCACGSRKDRHAPIGDGLIGKDKLNIIMNWCTNLSIPMVREF